MPFNIYCPSGHLLQALETQVGMTCQCPYCGSMFVIGMAPGGMMGPTLPGQFPFGSGGFPAAQMGMPQSPQGTGAQYPGGWPPQQNVAASAQENVAIGPADSPPLDPVAAMQALAGGIDPSRESSMPSITPKAAAPAEPPAPRVFHIPCPRGHDLETPEEMLGQEALCPICNTQFRLLVENSKEHRQAALEAHRKRQAKSNRRLIYASIAAGVIVVIMIVAMVLITVLN